MLIFHLNTNDKGKYNVGVEKVNIISMINTQIVKYLHKSVSLKQKMGRGKFRPLFFLRIMQRQRNWDID